MGIGASTSLLTTVRDGFLIQVAAWAIAAPLQTEKFYDLTGSLTFIYLTSSTLMSKAVKTPRNWVNSSLILLWACRLGSFLFSRILKDGKDRRFDKVKTKPKVFLLYWVIQGLWTVLTGLPVYLINTKEQNPEGSTQVQPQDMIAWSLWAIGFLLQVTADRQKTAFRAIPENKEKFITTGLFQYSQHPNYFGEMLMWGSLWLSSSVQMEGIEYLSIICPMFNIYLLRFVSGVPLLLKHAKKVWGDDPVWKKYHNQTPLLIPNPFTPPVSSKAN